MVSGRKSWWSLWAKYSRSVGEAGHHLLLFHLMDVAAVAWVMWEEVLSAPLRRSLASRLGLSNEEAGRSIAFLCGLHDLGKASPSFQAKNAEYKNRLRAIGFDFPERYKPPPHGVVTTSVLPEMLRSAGWSRENARQAAEAVGGHHGLFASSFDLDDVRSSLGNGKWTEVREDLFAELKRVVLHPTDRVPAAEFGKPNWIILAGLASVTDWIGSNVDLFPFLNTEADPAEYFTKACARAREGLEALGWIGWKCKSSKASLQELFPFVTEASGVQAGVERLLASGVDLQPGLAIIEAPMGEGKTEAAMLLADRWVWRETANGYYFALPTMATSDQMPGVFVTSWPVDTSTTSSISDSFTGMPRFPPNLRS